MSLENLKSDALKLSASLIKEQNVKLADQAKRIEELEQRNDELEKIVAIWRLGNNY